ncbi:MAG TPA: hypothetical protein PK112_07375, partial [candidate division Zixibacteria bacterium]|nr:hypothetical protein [candidate division Zixibacteria bacterium]
MRKRQLKGAGGHYLIAVNQQAGQFSDRLLRRLTGAIRSQGSHYTVIEPASAADLGATAREYCGLAKAARPA